MKPDLSGGKGGSLAEPTINENEDVLMLAETVIRRLEALGTISQQGKRLNGLFRLIENPILWHETYANIYANHGALTNRFAHPGQCGPARIRPLHENLEEPIRCRKKAQSQQRVHSLLQQDQSSQKKIRYPEGKGGKPRNTSGHQTDHRATQAAKAETPEE